MWGTTRVYYTCDFWMSFSDLSVGSRSYTISFSYFTCVQHIHWHRLSFFWWKNNTEDLEIDIDPCLLIIWCLCKKRNDKLFRKINRNPLKLIRYVRKEIGLTPNFRANKPNAELVQPTVNISSLMLGKHMFGRWIWLDISLT